MGQSLRTCRRCSYIMSTMQWLRWSIMNANSRKLWSLYNKSTSWNYVMNCWMQVKVYSGIIMPEIQRMTRWGSLFCNIMTRCGIVLQYFTPQLRPFTSWQVTLSAHCQAHCQVTLSAHTIRHTDCTLSGTLRKWRRSGGNPEPGVCPAAQAGQPSLIK